MEGVKGVIVVTEGVSELAMIKVAKYNRKVGECSYYGGGEALCC